MREEAATPAEFDATTYIAEIALKYEAMVALALLMVADPQEANSLGFQVVNSDGLGVWADVLTKAINAITVSAKHDFQSYTRSFTQKFGVNAKRELAAFESAKAVWAELDGTEYTYARTRLGLIQFFVALRNRTRGHGATTQGQYEAINGQLLDVLAFLLDSSPFIKEDLLRPMKVKGEKYSCRLLRGYPTQEQQLVPSNVVTRSDLLYYHSPIGFIPLPDFMQYVREDDSCYFLNSRRRRADDESEFLDYLTNARRFASVTWFAEAPRERPSSITAGRERFDWNDTVVNNLPKVDFTTYVPRVRLERELREYLSGNAVNFVSLEGQGGAGKTTLALRVARQIINGSEDLSSDAYDFVVWFSARDVDLDDRAGPLLRKRQVTSLSACASLFAGLLEEFEPFDKTLGAEAYFESVLTSGEYKFLLVFDNFESFDDTPTLQQFIKRNLAHPSKALMTSREDAFHGDVPIDIRGLTRTEASDLIRKTARQANCEPRVTESLISQIYEHTLGNPYAIKLLVNEFSRADQLDSVLPRAFNEDYLSSLFRRSFERLEDGAAYLFLILALSTLGRREKFAALMCTGRQIHYATAKRQLLDNHLIDAPDTIGEDSVFRASWAAQQFCRRVLVGHQMQRDVEQDLELLRTFTAEGLAEASYSTLDEFMHASTYVATSDRLLMDRNRRITTWLREVDAQTAARYALHQAREKGVDPADVRTAFKRAVELENTDGALWLSWAQYESIQGDSLRAVDLAMRSIDFTDDEAAIVEAARLALRAMTDPLFKQTTSILRRGSYTGSFIARLEAKRSDLSSRALGVLGWLYLQTNDKEEALRAASDGVARNPADSGCINLVSKLTE